MMIVKYVNCKNEHDYENLVFEIEIFDSPCLEFGYTVLSTMRNTSCFEVIILY